MLLQATQNEVRVTDPSMTCRAVGKVQRVLQPGVHQQLNKTTDYFDHL